MRLISEAYQRVIVVKAEGVSNFHWVEDTNGIFYERNLFTLFDAA